jgi:hypothetical protein
MTSNSQITIQLSNSAEETLALVQQVLKNMGAVVSSVDIQRGTILANKKMNLKSFGEDIKVSITPTDSGCNVNFYSESSIKTTIYDWGGNKDNVNRFVAELAKIAKLSSSAIVQTLKPSNLTHTQVSQLLDSQPSIISNDATLPVTKLPLIKVLFLSANPIDTPTLRLDAEVRSIDQAIRQADFRDRFDIRQQWAVRIIDLQGYLLRYKPDIVHFSGHGSTSSEIVLEDITGKSSPVPTQALTRLFSVLKDNIRCIILNACYSENQAMAIAEQIDCVIGMSKDVGDIAATSFSSAFYQALGYGRDVKTAFELGCLQINLENLGEENTPRLVALRSDPSKIFFT